jgi:hypothetical protein
VLLFIGSVALCLSVLSVFSVFSVLSVFFVLSVIVVKSNSHYLRTRFLKHKVQRSSISKTNNYLFMSLCLSTSLPLYLSVFLSLSIATALLNVATRQPPYIETVASEIRES